MKSKITGGPTTKLFSTKVLGKYSVEYFRCDQTGFIQTEEPYWLDESYVDAITELDIGLVGRNLTMRNVAETVIDGWFNRKGKFVDYGGGYGLFVRLLRDVGLDFYRSDPICVNLFAKSFDWPADSTQQAELLTAWEVFEHLPNPRESLQEMLTISKSILFSTELVPRSGVKKVDDWWYFTPETGQHVSLYTQKSLEHLAAENKLTLHTNGHNLHLLTDKVIQNPFSGRYLWLFRRKASLVRRWLRGRYSSPKDSLSQRDFDGLRSKLNARLLSTTEFPSK